MTAPTRHGTAAHQPTPTRGRAPASGAAAGARSGLLRPQTVLLLLVALAPYDGLLLLVPAAGPLGPWKVGLVVLSAGLAVLHSPTLRRPGAVPRWWFPMGLLLALSMLSILLHPSWQSVVGFRISYSYLLVPVVLWWCPFDAVDRDRLVTILMANGAVTAALGIAQQFIGAETLNGWGYAYNEVIRTSGGFLRSFSTFEQPFPFAFFVMIVILIGLPVALEDRSRRRNRWFLLALPLLVAGLGTAIVRGAFLGLAVGLVYLGVTRYRVIAHALVPLPVILVLIVGSSVGGALLSSSSLGERTTGWFSEVGGQMIEPLGRGIGTTGATAELFEAQRLGENLLASASGPQRYQADNQYVKMLVELGPLGLWLFAWAVIGATVEGHRLGRSLEVPVRGGRPAADVDAGADRALAFGIAAASVAAVAAALVATYWEIFPVDLMFWLGLGVLPSLRGRSS